MMQKLKYEIIVDKNTGEEKVQFPNMGRDKSFSIISMSYEEWDSVLVSTLVERTSCQDVVVCFPVNPEGVPVSLQEQKRRVEDGLSASEFSRARVLDTVTVVQGGKTLYAILIRRK